MERAFITGRGLVTPLGTGLAANEAALREGRSGIVAVEDFIAHELSCKVGGMPDQHLESDLIDRKKLRFCPPSGVMSVVAATEAFKEAGLPLEELPGLRIALVGGVAGANHLELFNAADIYTRSNFRLRSVSPFSVPRIMPSSAICNLSLIFGITGESYDVSAACAK